MYEEKIYVLAPSGVYTFTDRNLAEEFAEKTGGKISEVEKL